MVVFLCLNMLFLTVLLHKINTRLITKAVTVPLCYMAQGAFCPSFGKYIMTVIKFTAFLV